MNIYENILKIFQGQKIIQKDFNILIETGYNRIDNPTTDDKMDFYNTINGGQCLHCHIPWKQMHLKKDYADYIYYIPDCNCILNNQQSSNYQEKEIRFNNAANIPGKYHHVTIKDMNRDIKLETLEAIQKVKKYIQSKNYIEYGLILHGNVGVGKTHLAVVVMKTICIIKKIKGYFLHMSDLLNNIINDDRMYIQKIMKNDVVLLDDLDKANVRAENKSAWVNEQIFSLINGLYANGKIIIGTSNLENIKDFVKIYNDSIISRLIESCKFIQIKGDDYRLKGIK